MQGRTARLSGDPKLCEEGVAGMAYFLITIKENPGNVFGWPELYFLGVGGGGVASPTPLATPLTVR